MYTNITNNWKTPEIEFTASFKLFSFYHYFCVEINVETFNLKSKGIKLFLLTKIKENVKSKCAQ